MNSNIAEMSPNLVGIRAFELYFPRTYVNQNDLEMFDNVSSGKYTIGFGQEQMGFCGDHEDVASICMTVLSKLLNNYDIDTKNVGFLVVGSETLIDKSKSVKTQLMDMFGDNTDIEGVDVKNACFGGTQALFHAIDWIYANWATEERYAIVVMGDIAIYEAGPARCTGGAGAFAALIGPNALISFDRGLRATFMTNEWDFYKPVIGQTTEYPQVDGVASLKSYFRSLDAVYSKYCKKAWKLYRRDINMSTFDALFFHSPFSRLVQKAFGRITYGDFIRKKQNYFKSKAIDRLGNLSSLPLEETYTDREFLSAIIAASEDMWELKCDPYLFFNRRVGNMYTSSLYAQLVAFFHKSTCIESVIGKRLLFFSYGSGAASAMFSATVGDVDLSNSEASQQYSRMKLSANTSATLLDLRTNITAERYSEITKFRETLIEGKVPYTPKALDHKNFSEDMVLFPGTYYLKLIDERQRRYYSYIDL